MKRIIVIARRHFGSIAVYENHSGQPPALSFISLKEAKDFYKDFGEAIAFSEETTTKVWGQDGD